MRSAPLAALVTLLLLAPTAMAAWGLPEPVTSRMDLIQDTYNQVLLAGLLVFLFFFVWLVVTLVKFRPGGTGKRTDEDHRDNLLLEVVWTLIPLAIVVWLGFVAYGGMVDLNEQPDANDTVEIQVTGFQWFWQVDYGNGVVLNQQPNPETGSLDGEEPFHIPADTDVVFNVTGGDVIHSFWVPEFGGKVDATPGEHQFIWSNVPEGEYLLKCAEFCGFNHAYMRAAFKAVPAEDFEGWLDQKRSEVAQAGADQAIDVQIGDGSIELSSETAAADTAIQFLVTNNASSATEFVIEGAETNGTTGSIEPGATATLNTTLGAGTYTLTAGGASAELEVVEAESLTVSLTDFDIEPNSETFELGQTYVLNVVNEGGSVHNLFIGNPEEAGGSEEILYRTRDLQPGESTTLIFTPSEDEAGEWEWWCDIPGHYQLGMVGSVTFT